jgi:hypothetical protein
MFVASQAVAACLIVNKTKKKIKKIETHRATNKED